MGRYRAGLNSDSTLMKPQQVTLVCLHVTDNTRSHLASVSIFHDKTETVVGLKGILQCLRVEKNHVKRTMNLFHSSNIT